VSLWEKFQSRTLFYGGTSALAILLVAGILVFIVLLGTRHSLRWDLTRNQSQSLSTVSRTLLKEVDKPLTLTVFFPEGHPERQRAREILELYTRENPQVNLRFLDPQRDPIRANEAGYRRPGNVLLEIDGRKQLAETFTEEPISEALRRVLQKERKKIYFLTGHGERSGPREHLGFKVAKKALENEGYKLADLNLLKEGEVPRDSTVAIIAAPQKNLLPMEVEALKAYLDRGGRLFILLEPFNDAGLKIFLAGYGVNLNNGMIFEYNELSKALGTIMPLATQYGPSQITQGFNLPTLFPNPRPLFLNKELKTVTLQALVTTSSSSWMKLGQDWQKKWRQDKKPLYDPQQDQKGPFTVAALVEPQAEKKPKKVNKNPAKTKKKSLEPEKSVKSPQAFLAVFGDVDFAADEFFNQLGNGDLFLNTVNFLAAEEKQISIRKNDRKLEPLRLTGWQTLIIFFVTVILLPLGMLTAGVAAYLRRRAQR
jgi:ABC-type uncharacterized transport system involved in gliding motility auxiliary subunit